MTEPEEPGPVLEENPRIAEIEAAALARKQELLAKPEELKKSDELILGKTYTGTAYYLSNKGDDANDGLSPESPKASWESLKGKLKSGDAVLFECGSEWRVKFTQTGNVNYDICRDRWTIPNGVTLSSYGDGDRPMIRGDLAQEEVMNPDKWESFYDENGMKVWHYTDKINKPNVIVFDNGVSEAEIIMNCLNKDGKAINKDGMELSIDSLLEDNLTFAHLPDVNGVKNWKPDDTWAMGDLYLRCDEGNPAQIHQEICIPQVEIGPCIRDIGAIENLNISYFTYDGIELDDYGTLTHENITKNKIVENCIVKYCGGTVVYQAEYGGRVYEPRLSGGGIQTSGKNISVHDNYLYSCGPFALTISAHWYPSETKKVVDYKGIHEVDNYFECCGPAFHWADITPADGGEAKLSDIVFSGNYAMKTCEGRLQRGVDGGDSPYYGMGSAVENFFGSAKEEDITLKDNIFFLSRQPLFTLNSYNVSTSQSEKIELGAIFSGNTYVQYSDTPFLVANRDCTSPYYPFYQVYGKESLKEFLKDDTGEYMEYPVYSEKDRAYLNNLISYDTWSEDDNAEVAYTEYRNALIDLIQRFNPDKTSYFEDKVRALEYDNVTITRGMAFIMTYYAACAMDIKYNNAQPRDINYEEEYFTTAEDIFPTIWLEQNPPITGKWNDFNNEYSAATEWNRSFVSVVTAQPMISPDEGEEFHNTKLFTNVDACKALTRLYESKTRTRETSK